MKKASYKKLDEVITEIIIKWPHLKDIDYSKNFGVDYVNVKQKLIGYCKKHDHKFSSTINDVKRSGYGCTHCGRERTIKSKKIFTSFKQVIEKIYEKYPENITQDYSMNIDIPFENDRQMMKVRCTIHDHEYQNMVTNILYVGASCRLCAHETTRDKLKDFNTMEEAIKNILELNPELGMQDYSANYGLPYKNSNTTLKVRCTIHDYNYENLIMNIKYGAGCIHCNRTGSSREELRIRDIFNIDFKLNDKEILNGLELDLYSPTYKFGIEYNGSQFHSYGNSNWSALDNLDKIDKFKHQYKTNLMEEKGLQLFYIQESDWKTNRKQIWVSLINNKLGRSIKVGARKLKLYRVHENYRSIVNKFLDENHLQGAGAQYGIAYMLLDNDNIIHSIMTFGGIHNNTNPNYYELKRFCNRLGYNIMGAASRLLKAFENEFKPEYLLSYAKRDWSQGNLYEKIGFTFIGNTEPSMFYIKGNKRFPRQKFQKHKLHDLHEKGILENLNGSTAKEIMLNNGYRIYYDSGNKKYEKEYN